MTLDPRRRTAARAALALYADLVTTRREHLADGLAWLRFDDREFAVGDQIPPSGYQPPEWQDLTDRDQLRLDRLYIVRAASPDHVSKATWNEPRRWCYEVSPQRPLEPDPDPTHNFMTTRMCRSAWVLRILREPQPEPERQPAQ